MLRVNIHEAKTHLSRYLERVGRGESILVCKRNTPIAEIRPVAKPRTQRRPIGLAKGQLEMPETFFEPLPPEILSAFLGESE